MLLACFHAENYFYCQENLQKLVQAELLFLAETSTKSFGSYGFDPRPHRGSLKHSPDPLAVFRGPIAKRRKEGKGREVEKEGEGRRGKKGVEGRRKKVAYQDDAPKLKS